MIPWTPLLAKATPYLIGAALAVAWKVDHDRSVVERALLDEHLKLRGDTITALTRRLSVVDANFRVDTVRLTKAIRVKDSTTKSAEIKWLHETVPVPVTVVKEIVKADSLALSACLVTVSSCSSQVAVRDSLLGAYQRQLHDAMRLRPSWWSKAKGAVVWFGIGYGVRTLTHR